MSAAAVAAEAFYESGVECIARMSAKLIVTDVDPQLGHYMPMRRVVRL